MEQLEHTQVRIEDLKILFVATKTTSFESAAKELDLSTIEVMASIERLESRLKTKLFYDELSPLTLTVTGEKVLRKYQTIEYLIKELETEVQDCEATGPEGTVTISVSDGIGGYLLAPSLESLLDQNGQLDVRLDCGLWPDHPLDTEADILLTYDKVNTPGFISEDLAWLHYGLYVSPTFIKKHGKPTSLAAAVKFPFIQHIAQTRGTGSDVPDFLALVRKRIQTNSSTALFEGVNAGIGMAALPTWINAVRPELVLLGFPQPAVPLRMVYHKDLMKAPRIVATLQWLRETFDGQKKPWFGKEFVHPDKFKE